MQTYIIFKKRNRGKNLSAIKNSNVFRHSGCNDNIQNIVFATAL